MDVATDCEFLDEIQLLLVQRLKGGDNSDVVNK